MKNSLNIYLTSLGLSLIVALGLASPAKAFPYSPTDPAYLARQEVALQHAFRSDLEALAEAPRYILEASVNPEGGLVDGQMRLYYTNTSADTVSELVFRLYPNASTIYGGGSLNVEQVAQSGIALETYLSDDRTVLRVLLGHPLGPNQGVGIDLTFSAQVPTQTRQGYGIFNRALGVLCLAGWYPVLAVYDGGWQTPPVPHAGDAMLAETSLYEVTLVVPEGYEVVSSGTLLERQAGGGKATWHLVSGPAREFAVAISDRFQVLETRVGEVTIKLYTLPADGSSVAPEGALDIVARAFKTYVDRFGPYPFVEFDVVEAAIPIDGYEFSGMVYVDYGVRTREGVSDYEYIAAHEVAHQWWYGLVGNHTVSEPWLDESLATYTAALYLEDARGPGAKEGLLVHWARMEGHRQPNDPPINSSTLDFSSWGTYHKTVYTQGAFFLDQLREEMGDQKFFELLEHYQAAYRYRMATTADFLNLAAGVADQDLCPLFRAWFDTGAVCVSGD